MKDAANFGSLLYLFNLRLVKDGPKYEINVKKLKFFAKVNL